MSNCMPRPVMPFTNGCIKRSSSISKSEGKGNVSNPLLVPAGARKRRYHSKLLASSSMSLIWPSSTVSLGRRNVAGRKKEERNLNVSWSALEEKIAPEVFYAPKTGGDPHGQWPAVHERIVAYLLRNVVGTPRANHLALIAAVLSARRRDVQTVGGNVQKLHPRLRLLFQAFWLKHGQERNSDLHV